MLESTQHPKRLQVPKAHYEAYETKRSAAQKKLTPLVSFHSKEIAL